MAHKLPETVEKMQYYIDNQIQENLHLDYKSTKNFKTKEIAKDVSAFANADGGMIIYGIEEDRSNHFPKKLSEGIPHGDLNKEQLENIITGNITPKISGIIIKEIPASPTHSYFAIEIPKSYSTPHQDTSTYKYYKRYNFKSEPMAHYEIEDLRLRTNIIPHLVNVDIFFKNAQYLFLLIENIGEHPAIDLKISCSDNFENYLGYNMPPFLLNGCKYFSSKKQMFFRMKTFCELINNDKTNKDFTISVEYNHPSLKNRIADTFHFNLNNELYSSHLTNEITDSIDVANTYLNKIHSNMEKIEKSLSHIKKITSNTGLNISELSVERLEAIKNSAKQPKINLKRISIEQISEVLNIELELAHKIFYEFFHLNTPLKDLHKKGIISQELQEKINERFYTRKEERK